MSDYKIRAVGDLLLSAVVVCGSAVLFIGAAELPAPRFEPLGSAAMPRILGAILCLLSAIIAIQAMSRLVRGAPEPDEAVPTDTASGAEPEPNVSKGSPVRGVVVLAALVAYVAALDFAQIEFVLATTCFVAVTGMAMTRPGMREALMHAALGLAVALLVSSVFATYLHIEIG